MNRAGTLKVSKNTSAAFSRFLLGLSGASVRRTGCYKRWQGFSTRKDNTPGPKRVFLDDRQNPRLSTAAACCPSQGNIPLSASSDSSRDLAFSGKLYLAATDCVDPHTHSEEAAGPNKMQRSVAAQAGRKEQREGRAGNSEAGGWASCHTSSEKVCS